VHLTKEIGLANAKPVVTHIDPYLKLLDDQGEPVKYRGLVGKLNYLTVTHLDIAFARCGYS